MTKWGCLSVVIVIVAFILYLVVHGYEERNKNIYESEVIFSNESPNHTNIIEARLVVKESKGLLAFKEVTNYFTRIYYGKKGSVLETYKELKPSESISSLDEVKVHWEGENMATVEIKKVHETEHVKIYIPN